MNKYQLVNEDRAAEFIEELKEYLNYKKQELSSIENQIREGFFKKIPKNLERSLAEWSAAHKSEKWKELKSKEGKQYHSDFSYALVHIDDKDADGLYDSDGVKVETIFKSNENVIHKYREFNNFCQNYIASSIAVKRFENNIKLIQNYQLKDPNEAINDYLGDDTLSFNESLFCLLGLNPEVLITINIVSLSEFKDRKEDDRLLVGKLLLTREFRRLSKAPRVYGNYGFILGSTVFTNKFIQWALDKRFIKEIEESKDKQERNFPEDKLKILYTALKKDGFITGKFDDLWQWVSHRNQLAYLAKKLKQIRILGDDCHVELAHYIQDPKPESTKPLSDITKNPANTSAIDDVVNQLRG